MLLAADVDEFQLCPELARISRAEPCAGDDGISAAPGGEAGSHTHTQHDAGRHDCRGAPSIATTSGHSVRSMSISARPICSTR